MQKKSKIDQLLTILSNRNTRSLTFLHFNLSSIHCWWVCIQAIGADNYQPRAGSCPVTPTRERGLYPSRCIPNLEPQTGNKDCLNSHRHALLHTYN